MGILVRLSWEYYSLLHQSSCTLCRIVRAFCMTGHRFRQRCCKNLSSLMKFITLPKGSAEFGSGCAKQSRTVSRSVGRRAVQQSQHLHLCQSNSGAFPPKDAPLRQAIRSGRELTLRSELAIEHIGALGAPRSPPEHLRAQRGRQPTRPAVPANAPRRLEPAGKFVLKRTGAPGAPPRLTRQAANAPGAAGQCAHRYRPMRPPVPANAPACRPARPPVPAYAPTC